VSDVLICERLSGDRMESVPRAVPTGPQLTHDPGSRSRDAVAIARLIPFALNPMADDVEVEFDLVSHTNQAMERRGSVDLEVTAVN